MRMPLLVDADAVYEETENEEIKNFVYLVENGKLHKRYIVSNYKQEKTYLVNQGLEEGTRRWRLYQSRKER